MKLKTGVLLFTVLLAFTAMVVLFARAPVDDGGVPMVTPVATQQLPTNLNENDRVDIPCDPNEHQEIREAK